MTGTSAVCRSARRASRTRQPVDAGKAQVEHDQVGRRPGGPRRAPGCRRRRSPPRSRPPARPRWPRARRRRPRRRGCGGARPGRVPPPASRRSRVRGRRRPARRPRGAGPRPGRRWSRRPPRGGARGRGGRRRSRWSRQAPRPLGEVAGPIADLGAEPVGLRCRVDRRPARVRVARVPRAGAPARASRSCSFKCLPRPSHASAAKKATGAVGAL